MYIIFSNMNLLKKNTFTCKITLNGADKDQSGLIT